MRTADGHGWTWAVWGAITAGDVRPCGMKLSFRCTRTEVVTPSIATKLVHEEKSKKTAHAKIHDSALLTCHMSHAFHVDEPREPNLLSEKSTASLAE